MAALAQTDITTRKVAGAIGFNSGDVGTLCLGGSNRDGKNRINPWSVYKPVDCPTEDPNRGKVNCITGVDFTKLESGSLTWPTTNNIIYRGPQGGINSPYRLGDFRGYDHAMLAPLAGSTYYTDSITFRFDELIGPIRYYMVKDRTQMFYERMFDGYKLPNPVPVLVIAHKYNANKNVEYFATIPEMNSTVISSYTGVKYDDGMFNFQFRDADKSQFANIKGAADESFLWFLTAMDVTDVKAYALENGKAKRIIYNDQPKFYQQYIPIVPNVKNKVDTTVEKGIFIKSKVKPLDRYTLTFEVLIPIKYVQSSNNLSITMLRGTSVIANTNQQFNLEAHLQPYNDEYKKLIYSSVIDSDILTNLNAKFEFIQYTGGNTLKPSRMQIQPAPNDWDGAAYFNETSGTTRVATLRYPTTSYNYIEMI